ncbi:polycystin-1-like protein 2 [Glandiceps talaboti]
MLIVTILALAVLNITPSASTDPELIITKLSTSLMVHPSCPNTRVTAIEVNVTERIVGNYIYEYMYEGVPYDDKDAGTLHPGINFITYSRECEEGCYSARLSAYDDNTSYNDSWVFTDVCLIETLQNVTLIFTNYYAKVEDAYGRVADSVEVSISHGVSERLELVTSSDTVALGNMIDFDIYTDHVIEGTSYVIELGDGTTQTVMQNPEFHTSEPYQDMHTSQFSHAFENVGVYKVVVVASNEVSSREVEKIIYCIDIELSVQTPEGDLLSKDIIVKREIPTAFNLTNPVPAPAIGYFSWKIDGVYNDSFITYNDDVKYLFQMAGTYTVTLTAVSPSGSPVSVNKVMLTVVDTITQLYLASGGPKAVGQPVTLLLCTRQVGTNATYFTNLGDGTYADLDVPRVIENATSYVHPLMNLLFYPNEMFCGVFTHTYETVGAFRVTVSASNLVSNQTVSIDVFINDRHCEFPGVRIHKNTYNMTAVNKYTRKSTIKQTSTVQIDCDGPRTLTFNWTAHLVEDMTTFPDEATLYRLPFTVDTSQPELIVQPYTFGYGLYGLKLTVSMVDGMSDDVIIYNSDVVWIQVMETALVSRIQGGSAKARGWLSVITLDGSDSYDPDYPDDTVPLEYRWYCREDDDPPFQDPIQQSHSQQSGGCFGQGVYLSNINESSFTLDASLLTALQSYIFHLEVIKPDRIPGHYQQTITITLSDVYSLDIRCLLNCGANVNPSRIFMLTVECTDCPELVELQYIWTLHANDDSKTGVNLKRATVPGYSSRYLTFTAGSLDILGSKVKTYRIRVTDTDSSLSKTFAEYTFGVNPKPVAGSCNVTPSHGFVLETPFSIACDDFSDDDRPLTYQFSVVTGAETETTLNSQPGYGILLYRSQAPSVESIYLPVGVAERDYRVEIIVTVSDVYGASEDAIFPVTVNDTQTGVHEDEIYEKLSRIVAPDGSQLLELLETKDLQTVIQLLNSVTSVLNAMKKKERTDSGIEYITDTVEQRNKIRTSIMGILSDLIDDSSERLQQISSTMNMMTQEMTESSEVTRLAGMDVFAILATVLKSKSSTVDGDIVEIVALDIFAGISNIMELTLASLDNSINVNDTVSSENNTGKEASEDIAHNVTTSFWKVLDDARAAILSNKIVGEELTVLTTSLMTLGMQRREARDLDRAVIRGDQHNVGFRLPGYNSLSSALPGNRSDAIDLEVGNHFLHMVRDPFIDRHGDKVFDAVIGLEIMFPGNHEFQADNLLEELEFFLPHTATPTTNEILEFEYRNGTSVVINFNVSSPWQSVLVAIETEEIDVSFQLYLLHDAPFVTDTIVAVLEEDRGQDTIFDIEADPNTWFLSSEYLQEPGTYYISIEISGYMHEKDITLEIATYVADCLYWDKKAEKWANDGCRVGALTSPSLAHCLCNHLSIFGGTLHHMPSSIQLYREDISITFLDIPIIISVVVVTFVLYLILAIWANRKDNEDEIQVSRCFLDDNDVFAMYQYDVTVQTGYRRGAGTSATVTLTMYGTKRESAPHLLRQGKRRVLQAGSTDTFVIMTDKPLGSIESIRLWHDNGGDSPDWFVNHIIIQELKGGKRWYFLCNSWITIDLHKKMTCRSFPAIPEDEIGLMQLFVAGATEALRDRHLWFSIAGRPAKSSFTRLQRLSCLLSLLLNSMVANIMFYKEPGHSGTNQMMDIFVNFKLTWQHLIVGVMSSSIAFSINFFLVQIFLYTKPRLKGIQGDIDSQDTREMSSYTTTSNSLQETVSLPDDDHMSLLTDSHGNHSSSYPTESDIVSYTTSVSYSSEEIGEHTEVLISAFKRYRGEFKEPQTSGKLAEEGDKLTEINIQTLINLLLLVSAPELEAPPKKTRSRRLYPILPCQCVWINWLLVVGTITAATYFLMLYGLNYMRETKYQIDWLVSLLVSIVQSVLVEQFLSVFVSAVFVAFVCKIIYGEDYYVADVAIPSYFSTYGDPEMLYWLHEYISERRYSDKRYESPDHSTSEYEDSDTSEHSLNQGTDGCA